MSNVTPPPEFVVVIDDAESIRQQTEALLSAQQVTMRSFASLVTFLEWLDYGRLPEQTVFAAGIKLPELGGLDLLNILRADAVFVPTILMGSALSVSDAVEAMHAGASYILQKPFPDRSFRAALKRAMQSGFAASRRVASTGPMRRRLSSLSLRQREMLIHVSKGLTNREIAGRLSISQKTVELHRAAMMQKMGAGTLAELIRIAVECGDLLHTSPQNECA